MLVSLVALVLVASPALMLAPPAATSAHRLAQPVMQFGALGGQTPFAPRPEDGASYSSATTPSDSSAVGQSEVTETGEVVKKGKKKPKVDPNTGMLVQGRHRPDSSGTQHVPIPSPYHVFEPGMVTSRGYSDATRPSPSPKAAEEPTAPDSVQAGPVPGTDALSLANMAATAAPKGRGGDLGGTTWAGSGELHLGGTKATTRAPARRSGQTAASRVVSLPTPVSNSPRAPPAPPAPITLAEVTQLRKGADAAESALKELVQQRQADEAAFKEQMASPDGELTGDAYDALLAVHLAQRQSHAVDRATLEAMRESARLKAALGEQLFAAEQDTSAKQAKAVATEERLGAERLAWEEAAREEAQIRERYLAA